MKKQDGIHWRMPAAMCACWIIGLGLAIGHHFYYYSLDGTRVGNQSKQEWAQRFGTAFAFLTKTFLTTAVGIACIQSFWWILRFKPIRLSTLDSMFDIRGSIFNFFDFHIWLRGPNVAVLGLISWLIPLVTVVTPSTLSVISDVGSYVLEQPIPDVIYDFSRYKTLSEGGVGEPTNSITRQVMSSVIQGSLLQVQAPGPNASYTLDFIAPNFQCQNASAYVNKTVNEYLLDHSSMTFRQSFVAFVSSRNLTSDIEYLSGRGATTQVWYWHEDLNATDYAGKLIFAAYSNDLPKRSVVECAMYNTSFTVNFSWHNGQQSIDIINRTVLHRVLPQAQLTPDNPPANEKQTLAYTAIAEVLNNIFVGICYSYPQRCTTSQVYSTPLADSAELSEGIDDEGNPLQTRLPSLAQTASQMGDNLTLNLFSNSYFLQNKTESQRINVTFRETQTKYIYSEKNLLIGYGVSVFVSLLCVITGLLTMWNNGIAFTDSLSTIVRATRNKKFDDIVPGDKTTGSDPPPESLAKTQVLWVHPGATDDEPAGLKPIPAVAEPEKAENTGSSSPITYSNRIWERKSYRQTSTRVDNTSPEGFI